MFSLQKYNEASRIDTCLKTLRSGGSIALVSDAGTPNICDPGAYFVAQLREKGVNIVPIPGPCALTTFLSVSGFLANHFVMGGFFPKKQSEARAFIDSVRSVEGPIVFYESPRRLLKTILWLSKNYPVTQIVLGKELTKRYETLFSGTINAVIDQIQALESIKGEWVIGVQIEPVSSSHQLDETVASLKKMGLSDQQILAVTSDLVPLPRNAVKGRLFNS